MNLRTVMDSGTVMDRLLFDFPSLPSPFWTRMSAIVIPGVSYHFMLGMFGAILFSFIGSRDKRDTQRASSIPNVDDSDEPLDLELMF